MKKIVKISTAILLIMAMVLSFTGCGEIKKAETSVKGLFSALKEANVEKVAEYMNVDDFKSFDEEGESVTDSSELIIRNMFKKLEYKIVSSEKKDKSTVVVTAEITNTDMKPVMGEFFAEALQYAFANAFSNPQPSEEETNKKMEEILIKCVTKPDLGTVTTTADITVIKTENNKWRIKSDDAFMNALLGGLYDAAKEVEKSFENIGE